MHEHSSPRHLAGRHRRASTSRVSANTGLLTLSLGLCLCAGQLLTSGPAGAAPATAKAAAPAKAVAASLPRPVIADAANTRVVPRGKSVYITARVRDPRSGALVKRGTIKLQVWQNNSWRSVSGKRVAANGVTVFGAKPSRYTAYRTLYVRQAGYQWAVGNVVRVAVGRPAVATNAGLRVLNEAKRHVGAPYKFGASGPTRFDCSGFTGYVYKKTLGKSLPHKADAQQRYGVAVSKSAIRPGDLIVFRNGSYGYHAGIYAGGGYMYDSPHTGSRVGKHKIYGSNYVVRRLAA